MDQVTQQNAALVEEASAAAASLRDQAGNLLQAVSVFRLDDRHQGAVLVAPAIKPKAVKAKTPAPVPVRARVAAVAAAPKLAMAEGEWERF